MFYPEEIKLDTPLIFDSHAHYDDVRFDEIRDDLLGTLNRNGVKYAVTCSVDGISSENSLKIAEKYDYIYAAVGIHPENIESNTPISDIERLLRHPKCVAIGEIGLDYYYNSNNRLEQIEVFEKQILLANKLNLPVIVHDREAHADTLKILKKHKPKGVVHCFSGSLEMAEEILNLGMYISIGGVVTFKNAKKLPDIVKAIPDNQLLIETDCPYLAPEPYRGKLNHSGFLTLIADRIADIKNADLSYILNTTCENARELFNIK